MLHLYQLLIHLSIQSLSLFLSQDLIFKQSPFPFCIFLCKCKKKKKIQYFVVTHSSSLLLTSIIISLYPPETRGSCRDKRTFAPSFSLSLPHCLVYLVHNNFLTYALRYYKRVIFFFLQQITLQQRAHVPAFSASLTATRSKAMLFGGL